MIIGGTPQSRNASCQLYCGVADSKRDWRGLPDGGAKPEWSNTTADTYLVESQGKDLSRFYKVQILMAR